MPVRYMDLADVFGAENVVRLAASDVAGLGLGAGAVRVLTEVGLPRIPYGSFNPEPPARDAGRVRFARTAIGHFWLDLTDGEVRLSPKAANAAPLYVASTLEAFVECLLRHAILRRNKPAHYSDDPEGWATVVEEELRQVDPRAVEPGAYFAYIVGNLRDGF